MPTKFTARDDEALLDRLLSARPGVARDRVWREVVARYSRLIASCTRRTLHRWGQYTNEEDVDDLVSDVWIALLHDDLRRLRAFDPSRGARFSTFIGLIAANVTIDKLRRGRIEATSLDDLVGDGALAVRETITGELEDRQHAMLAQRALEELTPTERRFCQDVFADERDPAVLARELGVTKTTIYTRKVRMAEKLRRSVGRLAA